MDEIAIRKGHTYMTVFSLASTGRIVHAVEGKKKKDVLPFLEEVKKAVRLKAISMDMCRGYISAAQEVLPDIAIVYDRFHVMKLVNSAVDKVRKKTCEWLAKRKEEGNRKALKRGRFLFLKNHDLLDTSEKNQLELALAAYESLTVSYLMKERLRLFWNLGDRQAARHFLIDWCFEVLSLHVIVSKHGKDSDDGI